MSTATGTLHLEPPEGLEQTAWSAINDPLQRLNRAMVVDDLQLVVGTCKDLAESVAKVVLAARGVTTATNEDFPKLMTQAQAVLDRQPGKGLATDAQIRDVAQAALKIINNLPNLRNRFGTGHGRPLVPEVAEEVVLLSVDMTMMWTRWALRRLRHVIFGRPDNLIKYLSSGATFYRGDLAARLEAACLSDLAPPDQSALAIAVAHRALTGTFLVMEEGVEACAQSGDLIKWPDAYRVGLINGLVINADGEFDTSVRAVKQVAPLAASIADPAGVLAETARKAMRAVPSARIDSDATRQELIAAMPKFPRIPADAQTAWTELRERIEIPF